MALNLNIEKEHLVDLFDKTRSELVRATWQSYNKRCLEMYLPEAPKTGLLLEEDQCGEPGEEGVEFL